MGKEMIYLELVENVTVEGGGEILRAGTKEYFTKKIADELLEDGLARPAAPTSVRVSSEQVEAPDAASDGDGEGDVAGAEATGGSESVSDKVLIVIPDPAHRKGLKCLNKEIGLCEAKAATAEKKVAEGKGLWPSDAGLSEAEIQEMLPTGGD